MRAQRPTLVSKACAQARLKSLVFHSWRSQESISPRSRHWFSMQSNTSSYYSAYLQLLDWVKPFSCLSHKMMQCNYKINSMKIHGRSNGGQVFSELFTYEAVVGDMGCSGNLTTSGGDFETILSMDLL